MTPDPRHAVAHLAAALTTPDGASPLEELRHHATPTPAPTGRHHRAVEHTTNPAAAAAWRTITGAVNGWYTRLEARGAVQPTQRDAAAVLHHARLAADHIADRNGNLPAGADDALRALRDAALDTGRALWRDVTELGRLAQVLPDGDLEALARDMACWVVMCRRGLGQPEADVTLPGTHPAETPERAPANAGRWRTAESPKIRPQRPGST